MNPLNIAKHLLKIGVNRIYLVHSFRNLVHRGIQKQLQPSSSLKMDSKQKNQHSMMARFSLFLKGILDWEFDPSPLMFVIRGNEFNPPSLHLSLQKDLAVFLMTCSRDKQLPYTGSIWESLKWFVLTECSKCVKFSFLTVVTDRKCTIANLIAS